MPKLNKEVAYAVLHTHIHHPAVGQYGPVFQSWLDSARKATPMTLSDNEDFLVISVTNPKNKTDVVDIEVPITNVSLFVRAK